MRDIGQKTIKALEQFILDLEAGDLQSHRITKWVTCPTCNEIGYVMNCPQCKGYGAIRIMRERRRRVGNATELHHWRCCPWAA